MGKRKYKRRREHKNKYSFTFPRELYVIALLSERGRDQSAPRAAARRTQGMISHPHFICTRRSLNNRSGVELIQQIFGAWEDSRDAIGVFCDFSKAFDYVHHDTLIKKLHHYGVTGRSLGLLESYLSDKIQRVDLNDERSLLVDVHCARSEVAAPRRPRAPKADTPPEGAVKQFARRFKTVYGVTDDEWDLILCSSRYARFWAVTMYTSISVVLCCCFLVCDGKDLVVGTRANNVLISTEKAVYNSIPFIKRDKDYFYSDPKQRIIKGIIARDLDNKEAMATVTAGGVGHSNVTLHLQSERGGRLNYLILIFAANK
ncbi:hypothetical protein EVAR_2876_1 [Eumeta japonica]|uniref:Reverse transcriptase domain-containing protein n=1 Tax=Eumeta variegata TaxID=151549 RepID=A0A4C1T1L5_EUMVA|nr:hypothetical protein EVAR_2876_1 [Eumeta japonica]